MDKENLLPCPFCGSEAELMRRTEVIGHGACVIEHFVQCKKCRARGPLESEYSLSREDCVKFCTTGWNQRINKSEMDG